MCQGRRVIKSAFVRQILSLHLRQLHPNPPPSQVSLNAEVQRAQKQKLGRKFLADKIHTRRQQRGFLKS